MIQLVQREQELRTEDIKNRNGRGVIVSMKNGTAAFGLGPTGDIGIVTDSYNKSLLYLSVGYAMGLGASTGTGATITNKDFKANDIEEESVGFNITFQIFKGLFSGDGFLSSPKSHGIGLNIGIGAGFFIPHTYTITAPLPEFNDKFIYFSTYGH